MKINAPFVILATQLAAVYAGSGVAARTATEEECGALGVFKYNPSDLQANEDPSRFRKCKEHPMFLEGVFPGPGDNSAGDGEVEDGAAGTSPVARSEPLGNILAKRECLKPSDAQYGCSKDKWCWSRCGNVGQWCWLAWEGGKGAWRGCQSNNDCRPLSESGCGQGDYCESCGCSC